VIDSKCTFHMTLSILLSGHPLLRFIVIHERHFHTGPQAILSAVGQKY